MISEKRDASATKSEKKKKNKKKNWEVKEMLDALWVEVFEGLCHINGICTWQWLLVKVCECDSKGNRVAKYSPAITKIWIRRFKLTNWQINRPFVKPALIQNHGNCSLYAKGPLYYKIAVCFWRWNPSWESQGPRNKISEDSHPSVILFLNMNDDITYELFLLSRW